MDIAIAIKIAVSTCKIVINVKLSSSA